jgi:GT2 family glycosyltransferase
LDERFFLYYEDADFCWAARKAGFTSRIVPKASAYHLESSESGNARKVYWLVVSGILFFRKNTPGTMRPRMELYLFMRKCKNYLDRKKNRLSKEAAMVREAYRDVRKSRNIHHNRELPQF